MYNEDLNQSATPLRQMSLFESFKKAKPRSSIKLEPKVSFMSIDEVIEIEDDSDVEPSPPKLLPLSASENMEYTRKKRKLIGNDGIRDTPNSLTAFDDATMGFSWTGQTVPVERSCLFSNTQEEVILNDPNLFHETTHKDNSSRSNSNTTKPIVIRRLFGTDKTDENAMLLSKPDSFNFSNIGIQKTAEEMKIAQNFTNLPENMIEKSTQDSVQKKTMSTDTQEENINEASIGIESPSTKPKRKYKKQIQPNSAINMNKKVNMTSKVSKNKKSTQKSESCVEINRKSDSSKKVDMTRRVSKNKKSTQKIESCVEINRKADPSKKIESGSLLNRLSTNGVIIESVNDNTKQPSTAEQFNKKFFTVKYFPGCPDNTAPIQSTSLERHDNSECSQPTTTPPRATVHENIVLKNADNNIHEKQSSAVVSISQEGVSQISEHLADSQHTYDNFEGVKQPSPKKIEIVQSSNSFSTTKSSTPENDSTQKTSETNRASSQDASTDSPTVSRLRTPKKRSLSKTPSSGSPKKYGEVKSLKAKEGKQLQGAQLTELTKLMDTVKSNIRLSSLLSKEESVFIAKFLDMEDDKKYVLMKLFIYKRCWYNIFSFCRKAHIEEDKQVVNIFEFLKNHKFVDTDYKTSGDLISLLNELDRNQVYQIADELKLNSKITPRRTNCLKFAKSDTPKKTGSSSKPELIQRIIKAISTQSTLTGKSLKQIVLDKIEKKMGFAIKLKDAVHTMFYHIYLLGTFANPKLRNIQDYFKMIIYDRVVFPEANIDDWIVFYSRDKFVAYAEALLVREELENILDDSSKENRFAAVHNIGKLVYDRLKNMNPEYYFDHKEVKSLHLIRFTAEHVYSKILSKCCEQLYTKTNGKPEDVKKWLNILINNFPKSNRIGKWIHKLAWIHMRHLNDINYETAANILIDALMTKNHLMGDRDLYDLGVLGQTLKSSKKYKIDQLYHDKISQLIPKPIEDCIFPTDTFDAQCIRSNKSGTKRKYISKSIDSLTVQTVEQQALDHYKELGFPVGDAGEGRLVKALLVLYFWDIIYNPEIMIPGVFVSKFQSAPLDMFTPLFYENRKDVIDARLEDIREQWSSDSLIEFGTDVWQKHSHEQSVYGEVGMVIEDANLIQVLVKLIGGTVLSKIFERIIKNIREFSSGMPDLLVWNQSSYKFVEVKGEGDTLAIHQKMWLKYLQDIGGSIEVCHVHSMGSKRKIIKVTSTDFAKNDDKDRCSTD